MEPSGHIPSQKRPDLQRRWSSCRALNATPTALRRADRAAPSLLLPLRDGHARTVRRRPFGKRRQPEYVARQPRRPDLPPRKPRLRVAARRRRPPCVRCARGSARPERTHRRRRPAGRRSRASYSVSLEHCVAEFLRACEVAKDPGDVDERRKWFVERADHCPAEARELGRELIGLLVATGRSASPATPWSPP